MSLTSTPTSRHHLRAARYRGTAHPHHRAAAAVGIYRSAGLWGNLGISLFGPLTGALIATTAGSVGWR
jgi:hypothetical protein